MQIKARLTLQFLLAVAPILLISFVIIYLSSSEYRKKEFYSRLNNKALTTAEFLIKVEQVDSTLLKVIDRTQKDNLYGENITVYNYLNQEVYTNNDTVFFDVNEDLIDDIRLNHEIHFTQGDFEIIGITYNDKYNRFVVIAGAIDLYGKSKLVNLRNTLVLLFFAIIILAALAGWIYSSRALKPILKVIDKAEKISAKNLSERLQPTKYNDEIGRLVNAFNRMLARIEDSFNVQKLFVAGASHELKNPLTVITSQLEVAGMKERTNEEYRQTIASVLDDIKDLNILTTNLIDFSRLSQQDVLVEMEKVRIDELLSEFVDAFKKRHSTYIVNYKIAELPANEDMLLVNVNTALIITAFNNITENACKFSADNTVDITLKADNNLISVTFSNNAIIPEYDRPFIFEPFYRSKSSMQVKGYGIGLAMVSKIMNLHGSTIILADDANKTVFVLSFSHL